MTAFISSVKRNPSKLWLFSFSPYFSEDISKLKKVWLRYIGYKRVKLFQELDFTKLAKSIKCKTLIFYGELEARKYPIVGTRSNIAHKKILNSILIKVPKCGHDVTNKNYLESIQKMI